MKAPQQTLLLVVVGVILCVSDRPTQAESSETKELSARTSPYATAPDHLWNRLHRALFMREDKDGMSHIHKLDPLLYRGGNFLLEGESHRHAVALLDEFIGCKVDSPIDGPLARFFLQRDLWAAFDYAAWVPDDWVLKTKYEPAAIELRDRLAKAIGRLALSDYELAALPNNYALAAKSQQFPADYDRNLPDQHFLPPDLFDPAGPWVRYYESNLEIRPMTRKHFDGAGGRAAHIVFLRLPGGRIATEEYLKQLRPAEPFLKGMHRHSVKQFPQGTMVAMVRRAVTIDRSGKIRVTPITEQVQIRVFRRIPADPEAFYEGDRGDQDVYEFLLDRQKLIAGEHGLRAVGNEDPAEPGFERHEGADSFERTNGAVTSQMPELKTCIECHSQPGVYSLLSMERGLRTHESGIFRTFDWDVELSYTVKSKTSQFNWGLLQGLLEAERSEALPARKSAR